MNATAVLTRRQEVVTEYKELRLRNGMIALVDAEDFDYVNQWSWTAREVHGNYYVERKRWKKVDDKWKKKYIRLHRLIMKAPDGLFVDHINHDTLDCRKSNMRLCNIAQNNRNRRASGKSKYLGVSLRGDRFIAQIKTEYKVLHLGVFRNEEEAAQAYNKAAIEFHGEFANLNVIQ